MSNHINDTPRTDEAEHFIDSDRGITCSGLARQLERELNAANAEIERLRKANLQLREGAEEQRQRIKRLEDRIHRAASAFFRDGSDGQVASGMLAILEEERGKP